MSRTAGESPTEDELEGELLAGASGRTGWFRFYFDDQRWEWSDEVRRLHGYQPGTVTPTMELVLSHKHPDDRDEVAATIDRIIHTRGVFSGRHRIIDTGGAVRSVIVIGDQFFDDDGAVIGTHGFYVDVSPSEQAREDAVTAKVSEITEHRAAIERAKGMLMLVYDIDAEAAFDLLKWLSQATNVKVRALCERLCGDLRGVAASGIFDKTLFDHALLKSPRALAR
ncbi:PAS and ANTAR domain-containing protein [Mycobacterium sp. 1165178.9]|uniref:PAS and ANTAR domain-containing protein n=1 Tax=Mycobacterium sp. 1165178.9 TaxID=1834070 RepID=UPI0009F421F3|nr:PAS and ANTAR domain-containing protein [Mycobacterium sp. 1165178.9]